MMVAMCQKFLLSPCAQESKSNSLWSFQNLISSTAESGYDFITIPIVNPRSYISKFLLVVCYPYAFGQARKRVPDR